VPATACPRRPGPTRYDEGLQRAAGSAPADDTDTTLMVRAAEGNLAAFEELVRRNQEKAWGLAWRFLGDASEAEDIVQEAFFRVFKAASRYRPSARFRTYLFQIITRLCLDWEAKKRPEYTDSLGSIPDVIPDPEGLFSQNELSEAVRKCLAELPSNQRLVIVLRHYEGLSYEEIADILNVSAKAVDSLLQRARDTSAEGWQFSGRRARGLLPCRPFQNTARFGRDPAVPWHAVEFGYSEVLRPSFDMSPKTASLGFSGRSRRSARMLPAVLACVIAWPATGNAQRSFTVREAVERALDKYPSIRVSIEQVASAAAGINLARTSYLPRADMVSQFNRATRNNVSGLLFPQSGISPISGPVIPGDLSTNVWGSAVGMLVSWEPFDFGLRRANVEAAEASRTRAEKAVVLSKLQVGTAAADAFLTVLAAQQSVAAGQAGVNRAHTIYQVVQALVNAKLRPGAEASRMRAEVALAETQLIQAQQSTRIARAAFAQFLDVPSSDLSLEPGPLLESPATTPLEAAALRAHPAVQEQNAAVDEIKARERVIDKTYYPRLNLLGTTFARGTGSQTDGTTRGAMAGLAPNIQNWAFGLNVTFPLFDLPSLRARREIEIHRERAETARREQIMRGLQAQLEEALASLEGARRVAENTPYQLEAARAAEQQATARYKAGLGNIVEVAEAERLLTQSEIDDSLARLNVWRAILAVASAQGDIGPFLQQTGK
jgi:outer membrane protein